MDWEEWLHLRDRGVIGLGVVAWNIAKDELARGDFIPEYRNTAQASHSCYRLSTISLLRWFPPHGQTMVKVVLMETAQPGVYDIGRL